MVLIFAIAGVGFPYAYGDHSVTEIIAGFLEQSFSAVGHFKHSLKRHPGCAGSCCVYLCRPAFKGPSGIQNGCQSAGRYAENDLSKVLELDAGGIEKSDLFLPLPLP